MTTGIPAQSPTVRPCCMLVHSRYTFGVDCGSIIAGLFAPARGLTEKKNPTGKTSGNQSYFTAGHGWNNSILSYIFDGGKS